MMVPMMTTTTTADWTEDGTVRAPRLDTVSDWIAAGAEVLADVDFDSSSPDAPMALCAVSDLLKIYDVASVIEALRDACDSAHDVADDSKMRTKLANLSAQFEAALAEVQS